MSVLGTSTQVAPGNSLFAASNPPGVGTSLSSPVAINAVIGPTSAGISQAFVLPNASGVAPNEGALHLGSSSANPSIILMRDRSPGAGGNASVIMGSGSANAAAPAIEVFSTGGGATPAFCNIQASQAGASAQGQVNLTLGTDTRPQMVIMNDNVIGTTQGTGLTLNTNVFLAPSGSANLAFDINGYDMYVGPVVPLLDNGSTVITNPVGLTPGIYAITTGSLDATRLPFSTVAQFTTANGWVGCCAYAPGGLPVGGAPFTNAVLQRDDASNNLEVFQFTGLTGRTVQLNYTRLTGGSYNFPNFP